MPTDRPILVVDDDTNTREGLALFLESRGYTVVVAVDGADALEQLRAGLRPSLILLDLMMPEKNGFQFRVEQVMDPELSKIPICVFSGVPDATGTSAILGGVAQLDKPIDLTKLLEVVRSCCAS